MARRPPAADDRLRARRPRGFGWRGRLGLPATAAAASVLTGPSFRMLCAIPPAWPEWRRPCVVVRTGERMEGPMTTTRQASGASPVDFATFGDYGDFKPKKTAAPAAPSQAISFGLRIRSRAGSRPMVPAGTRPSLAAITSTFRGRARGRTAPPSCATCSACRRHLAVRGRSGARRTRLGVPRRRWLRPGPGERLCPAPRRLRGDGAWL